MKEKTKASLKAVLRYWRKERLKPFLIKTAIILLIVAVAFGLFFLLMRYLVACGVAAGLEPFPQQEGKEWIQTRGKGIKQSALIAEKYNMPAKA